MNVLLRSSCLATRPLSVSVAASTTRLFHGSAANFGLPKKKLKPRKPEVMINGVPLWQVKKEKMEKQKVVLNEKFQDLVDRPVIHMPKPKLQAWVTDLSQNPTGIVDLNQTVWNQEIRKDIVHRVVRWQRNAWRQGTHKGKGRGEVRGGGRKPHPQKGTGRARQGSTRSPLNPGGGKAHPPTPRDYSFDLPIKVVKKGIMIALTAKYKENNLYVIDNCTMDSHKTKDLNLMLQNWDIGEKAEISFIHGLTELEPNFILAARNYNMIQLYTPKSIGVYQILRRQVVFITRKGLQELEARLTALPGIHHPAHPRLRALQSQVPGVTPVSLNEILLRDIKPARRKISPTNRRGGVKRRASI